MSQAPSQPLPLGPPPISRYNPSAGWQSQASIDPISSLQMQITSLQKSLGEEIKAHNQARTSQHQYRDSALSWELYSRSKESQMREMAGVIANLQQRVNELESMLYAKGQTAPSSSKDGGRKTGSNTPEDGQPITEASQSSLRSPSLTPPSKMLPSSILGKRHISFDSIDVPPRRLRKIGRPPTPRPQILDSIEETWESASGHDNHS